MSNITFQKIKINNFLSLKDVEVDLSGQGFVLVKGINNNTNTPQSNGSGKSSIFDAIFWALTGETLRGTTEVVNINHTNEGCLCSLDFKDDDNYYTITRTKSHKEFGNSCRFFVNDELVSDQIKKTQEMISQYVPSVSNSEILGSIVLLGQGLPFKFSSFSPTRRKDLLETMSGSNSEINSLKYKLDQKEEEHRQKIREATDSISFQQGTISALESTVSSLERQISDINDDKELDDQVSQFNDEILDFQRNIDEVKEKLQESEKEFKTVSTLLPNVRNYYQTLNSAMNNVSGTLNGIKSGNCPTCGRPYEVTEEMQSRRSLLQGKLSDYLSQIGVVKIKLDQLQSSYDTCQRDINNYNNLINQLSYSIEDRKRRIEDLSRTYERLNDLKDQIKESKEKIAYATVLKNDQVAIVEKENEIVDCIMYLKRQLSRDFKGYILEESIEFLSKRSEYYSSYFFNNNDRVKVSLSGNKILITAGGRLYENLSGGERQRVDLSVQFALRDMLMTSSGFSCNLLILDEAFDNLDSSGSESLIKLIVSEFSDIETIFIITHHSEIDIPYDKRITIVKDSSGDSYVR